MKSLTDLIQQKFGLPSTLDHLVLAPSLGRDGSGTAADPELVATLLAGLVDRYPGLAVSLVGHRRDPQSGADLMARSGFAELATSRGWEMIDLDREPSYHIAEPRLPFGFRLPALALTDHLLISVAALGTDPHDGLLGMLAHHLNLFPELSAPHLRPYKRQAVAMAAHVWKPDICVLDARRVPIITETKLTHSVAAAISDTLIIGAHPDAVDRRAAQWLGLDLHNVPLLSAEAETGDAQETILVGAARSTVPAPLPTPHAYPGRIRERAERALGTGVSVTDRLLELADVPRLVDFVRRAGGLPG